MYRPKPVRTATQPSHIDSKHSQHATTAARLGTKDERDVALARRLERWHGNFLVSTVCVRRADELEAYSPKDIGFVTWTCGVERDGRLGLQDSQHFRDARS